MERLNGGSRRLALEREDFITWCYTMNLRRKTYINGDDEVKDGNPELTLKIRRAKNDTPERSRVPNYHFPRKYDRAASKYEDVTFCGLSPLGSIRSHGT